MAVEPYWNRAKFKEAMKDSMYTTKCFLGVIYNRLQTISWLTLCVVLLRQINVQLACLSRYLSWHVSGFHLGVSHLAQILSK